MFKCNTRYLTRSSATIRSGVWLMSTCGNCWVRNISNVCTDANILWLVALSL